MKTIHYQGAIAMVLIGIGRGLGVEASTAIMAGSGPRQPVRLLAPPCPQIRYVSITKPSSIVTVTGIVAPFYSLTETIRGEPESPYREMLTPVCFLKSLRTDDVEFVSPGHRGKPLGSSENGRLKLWTDTHGMHFEFAVPRGSLGDELVEGIRRGVFKGMSMRFVVDEDMWTSLGCGKLRIITAASLEHICPARNPVQVGTEIRIAKEA